MALVRPVVFVPLGILVLACLVYLNGDSDDPKKPAAAAVKPASTKDVSDYTADDFSAHFDAPKAKLRSIFMPLVVPAVDHPVVATTAAPKDPDGIPADLAGGDPNWIFTGYAVVSGVTMALLENQSTHHSELVKQGAAWKTSRLESVTTASILLVGKEGVSHVVLRHVAKAAPPATAGEPGPGGAPGPGGMPGPGGPGGAQPFNPANGVARPIRGPIGMPPGVTIINN